MKKIYETPDFKITNFYGLDVITDSENYVDGAEEKDGFSFFDVSNLFK